MCQGKQTAQSHLEWRDTGVPVSVRFDDPYYSLDHGLAETRHVFLEGNALPQRLCDGFEIAELGFGTGLNFFATLELWRALGIQGQLRFTSFELYPLEVEEMRRALGRFDGMLDLAAPFLETWREHGVGSVTLEDVIFDLCVGDARDTVPQWERAADAWYLDGFSPAKNPELWSDALLCAVGAKTRDNGTCATYTAAGHVRRALGAAGFSITRVKGYGRKRHMSVGHKGTQCE